jgi:hypothetical protein
MWARIANPRYRKLVFNEYLLPLRKINKYLIMQTIDETLVKMQKTARNTNFLPYF